MGLSEALAFVAWATRAKRASHPNNEAVMRGRTASICMPASSCRRGSAIGSSGVCRYALRPPVTQERIHVTDEGQVRLQLRQPWRDGTTDVVFDPVEFLGRLAVLVPRPRINLILYHGVLGPRAAWRSALVLAHVLDGNAAHDGFSVGVLLLAVIRQDDDGMGLRNLGAAQDHFVDGVAFDDIDVVEGGFIQFVRQHDFVGCVVNDYDWPLVGDDTAVHFAYPIQCSRRPVAQHQMTRHFKIRHLTTP